MRCFIKALRDYANFGSRSGLREYWLFVAGWAVIGAFSVWLDRITGSYNFRTGIAVFESFWLFGFILPWMAASVRRLHDGGFSGWWLTPFLLVLLHVYIAAMPRAWPHVAFLWPLAALGLAGYLVIMAWPGDRGENRFGRPEQPWC